jgi:cytochrome c-type biogenesis protein CcmF
MVANIGFGVLVITLVISLAAVVTAVYGVISKSNAMLETARRAALTTFPLLSIAILSLVTLLVTSQFGYVYVFQTTSLSMPLYLKVAALWGGQEGSLLFWCWLLSGFTFIVLIRKWKEEHDLLPWVIAVTSLTLMFFMILVLFFENPFQRYYVFYSGEVIKSLFHPYNALAAQPSDGTGLNPLLRHPGMVAHPPMLYLGFVGFIIPYAYAIAALIQGRSDDRWLKATRKWSLMAWLFLSIGLVLGSRWAYDVLGGGGYWGWDPVEISAFMPWLIGTAYLHSMVMQEKRGLFKHWNITLIILTFCLVIFGTFLTRSGLLSSVHAFSESAIGPAFFVFISLMFILSLGLLLYRWSSLSSSYQIRSFFSRESAFLFNNLLFMAIFLICLLGVLFPIFSELFTGQKVTVGPPFYKSATGPLFGLLFLLMGIVPLTAWRTSTAKNLGRSIWKPAVVSLLFPVFALIANVHQFSALFAIWLVGFVICVTLYDYGRSIRFRASHQSESIWNAFITLTRRNRRRYGGYIIHLGVVLMGLGIIGIEFFQSQTQATIKVGESISLSGYNFTFNNLEVFDTSDGRNIARADIQISMNGRNLKLVSPRSDYYYESQQSVTIPGLRSTLADDLYVVLVDWETITLDSVTFKIFRNPLISWLWLGSIVLVVGTLVALWPATEPKKDKLEKQALI